MGIYPTCFYTCGTCGTYLLSYLITYLIHLHYLTTYLYHFTYLIYPHYLTIYLYDFTCLQRTYNPLVWWLAFKNTAQFSQSPVFAHNGLSYPHWHLPNSSLALPAPSQIASPKLEGAN